MQDHNNIVKAEFTRQAANFGGYQQNEDKIALSMQTIEQLGLRSDYRVLEVAAGTCAFGRLAAPNVAEVVELDATEAMLTAGLSENERLGLHNVSYIVGEAEHLPFGNEEFDAVLCRLTFHHFNDSIAVMREMARVLKRGGHVGIIDVVPNDNNLRTTADRLEKMRDPSHVSFMSVEEIDALLKACDIDSYWHTEKDIAISLSSWLKLTDRPTDVQQAIIEAIDADLSGKTPTGLAPHVAGNQTYITHRWHCLAGRKR